MMLLNEPKNVTENTGRVMIHTFQPGSRLSLNQLIQVLLHDIVFTGYLNKYSFITNKIKVFMGRKNS